MEMIDDRHGRNLEAQAVESATRSVDLTTNQYKAGTVSYLNVPRRRSR